MLTNLLITSRYADEVRFMASQDLKYLKKSFRSTKGAIMAAIHYRNHLMALGPIANYISDPRI